MGKRLLLATLLIAGCATKREPASEPLATPMEGVRKVIENLAKEIEYRRSTDAFRGRPVVVQPSSGAGTETIAAELLRTRLVDDGAPVDRACVGRCMEVLLQEFVIDAPSKLALSPGQILTVASGSVPVVGGLFRSIGERETEKQRARNRTNGYMVTFSARDDNRYAARVNLVAITRSGDLAVDEEER